MQRAQFGEIYRHCDTKKGKFRKLVTMIAKHTNDTNTKQEYLSSAAESMLIDEKKLGRFNVMDEDFKKKLEKIL